MVLDWKRPDGVINIDVSKPRVGKSARKPRVGKRVRQRVGKPRVGGAVGEVGEVGAAGAADFERAPLSFPDVMEGSEVGELSADAAQRAFAERKLGVSSVGALEGGAVAQSQGVAARSQGVQPQSQGVVQPQSQGVAAQSQGVQPQSQGVAAQSQGVVQPQVQVQAQPQPKPQAEAAPQPQPQAEAAPQPQMEAQGQAQQPPQQQATATPRQQGVVRVIPHASFKEEGNKGIARAFSSDGVPITMEKDGDILTYKDGNGSTLRIYPSARRKSLSKGLRVRNGMAYDRWNVRVLWDDDKNSPASRLLANYDDVRNYASDGGVLLSSGGAAAGGGGDVTGGLGYDLSKDFWDYTPAEQEAYIRDALREEGHTDKTLADFLTGSYEGEFEPDKVIEATKGLPLSERLTALSEHGVKTGNEVPMSYFQKLLGDASYIDETSEQRVKRETKERRARLIGGLADVFANLLNVSRAASGHTAYKVDHSALKYLDARYEQARKEAEGKRDALLARLLADVKLVGEDKRHARKAYDTWLRSAANHRKRLEDLFAKYRLAKQSSDAKAALEGVKQEGMHARQKDALQSKERIAAANNATKKAVAAINGNFGLRKAAVSGSGKSGSGKSDGSFSFRVRGSNEVIHVNANNPQSLSAAASKAAAAGLKGKPFELKGSGPMAGSKTSSSYSGMATHLMQNIVSRSDLFEVL